MVVSCSSDTSLADSTAGSEAIWGPVWVSVLSLRLFLVLAVVLYTGCSACWRLFCLVSADAASMVTYLLQCIAGVGESVLTHNSSLFLRTKLCVCCTQPALSLLSEECKGESQLARLCTVE